MNSDDPVQFVGELNQFYARFDVTDFSSGCDHVCDGLVGSPVAISEPEVKTWNMLIRTKLQGLIGLFFGGWGGGETL